MIACVPVGEVDSKPLLSKKPKGSADSGLEVGFRSSPRGEPDVLQYFFDSSLFQNELIRAVLSAICSGKSNKVFQPKEKESFSIYCLKVLMVFGQDAVRQGSEGYVLAQNNSGSSAQLSDALAAWMRLVSTSDSIKSFSNSLKKLLK